MAQPDPYTRTANFTAALAGTSLAALGPLLDAEFNEIRSTVEATRTNIGEIQRDDLELANRSVGYDQLNSDARTLLANGAFTIRGPWATATAYAVGDVVSQNNILYLTMVAHTANASLAVDLAAGRLVGPVFDAVGGLTADDIPEAATALSTFRILVYDENGEFARMSPAVLRTYYGI